MSVILTYNVNGIRAALRKGLDKWIESIEADVICLQEIKANVEQIDEAIFTKLGYYCYWNSAQKKGYSGVAILTKEKPNHIEYGCGDKDIDFEGRFIRVDFERYSVMSVYFPSGSSGSVRQEFKMYFLKYFQSYIIQLKKDISNLVLCGDYNICHQEIDIHNPIQNKNTSGFLPEEREWISNFLESGFIDSFRYFNNSPHNYTWWSYRANSRPRNLGWRIDYQMTSKNLSSRLRRSQILSKAYHSDHCPVLLEIDV